MRWNCYKKVSKSTFWRQHDYSKRQMDANGLNYLGNKKGSKFVYTWSGEPFSTNGYRYVMLSLRLSPIEDTLIIQNFGNLKNKPFWGSLLVSFLGHVCCKPFGAELLFLRETTVFKTLLFHPQKNKPFKILSEQKRRRKALPFASLVPRC